MRTSLIAVVAILLAALSTFVITQRNDDGAAAGATRPAVKHAARAAQAAVRPVPTTPATKAPTARPRRAAPDPCAGNRGHEVLVSIARQHEWLCNGGRVHASFAVTTGRHRPGDRTPTGTYAIQARTRDTTLSPSSGGNFHVKYWLPFKLGIYGFHDAPWQTIPFGSRQYTTGGSQGCVHMRTEDIARLFAWVQLGTRVRIVEDVVSD